MTKSNGAVAAWRFARDRTNEALYQALAQIAVLAERARQDRSAFE